MKQVLGVVDAPISGVESDALGLQPYAQALGRFILECDSPMTVGIQGDWGAGKTSLMMLDEESFEQAARDPDFTDKAAPFTGTTVRLAPFAVARLDVTG